MALGEFKLFQWKNKKQQEKEQQEYAQWAFPYGELQRANLTQLMRELKPKDAPEMLLVSFLTCKELYEDMLAGTQSSEDAVRNLLRSAGGYSQLIRKADTLMYIAVVLADAGIDEACVYPSADDIRSQIRELEELKKKK
jgi:hypothetical protein